MTVPADDDVPEIVIPELHEIPEDERDPLQRAMYEIAEALQYPVDNLGRVYDVRYIIPVLAFHLARAGMGRIAGQAVIKPRRVPPGAQVVEDAIEWVPLDAPDTVAEELARVTSVNDLQHLSPQARAIAIRDLLGGSDQAAAQAAAQVPLDDKPGWHTQTSIQFDD